MSKKTFGTIFKIIGIAALTFATAGAAGVLLAGGSLAIAGSVVASQILLGSIALSIGSTLLAVSKASKAASSARAEQIRAMVNPQAKANWVFGETATAIQIIYSETAGSKNDRATLVYAGPAHEIESYGQLYINDEAVNFSGNDATGAWAGAVKRYLNLGEESQTALSIPNSTWPATARGRGFAHFALQWSLDHDKVKDGGVIPDRITQVIEASLCYDPRLDTTVGGSGLHRADDQTTWEYSANWALVCLHYILGWTNNSELVYGRGADPLDIDYASFITAANVCDATVDGIPRYHIGGIERIDGDHARVMASLEATIGGKIAKIGGKYFCWAPNDDLTSLETISENDLIRNIGVNFQADRSIENIYTVGRGQFIDPSVLYVPVPYPEVKEDDAIVDLGKRIMNYDTPFLQNEKRVQRVILQQIRRSLFGRIWQIGVGPKFFRRRVFDIMTLNIEETNFTNTLVRITNKVVSAKGLIILTLEEENSLIYDVTAALGTAESRNVPPTFDHATKIPVVNLVLTAVTVTGSAGTASDAIQVSYDDPGPLVNRTDIEIRVNSTTNWHPAASKILDAGIAIILPVESGTLYDVRVRHWTLFDVPSDFVTDTVTAGQSQVVTSSVSTPWAGVTDRPLLLRAVAVGFSSTSEPIAKGLYDEDNVLIFAGALSYTIDVYDRATSTRDSSTIYNVFGDAANALTMATDLNALGSDKIVIIRSFNEPQTNRLTNGLDTAIYRCGGSRAVFGSINFKFRSAYILLGIPGIGEGNGVELYSGDIDSDADAWVDTQIQIMNGNIILSGVSARAAVDISYSDGTLVEDLKPAAIGADVTSANTAANIAGQGGLAILNDVDWQSLVVGTGKPLNRLAATLSISGSADDNIWVRILQLTGSNGRGSGILRIASPGGHDIPGEFVFEYNLDWASGATIHFTGASPNKMVEFRVSGNSGTTEKYLDIKLGTFTGATTFKISVIPETISGAGVVTLPLTKNVTVGAVSIIDAVNILNVIKGHHFGNTYTQTKRDGSKIVNGQDASDTVGDAFGIINQGDLATLDTVDTAQIDALAITNAKLAALAVDAAKLASNSVTEIKIFSSAVTTAKLNALAVTAAKLAGNAVTPTKIAALAVGTAAIAALAVTEAKIGALAVTSAKIANLAVGTAAIANLAVDFAQIKDLAVDTIKVKDNAITVPRSAYTAGEQSVPGGSSTEVEIQSLAFTSSGASNLVTFSFDAANGGSAISGFHVYLRVTDGSRTDAELMHAFIKPLDGGGNGGLWSASVEDTPSGSVTYKVLIKNTLTTSQKCSHRSIVTVDLKK